MPVSYKHLDAAQVPILGKVTAGIPILAVEDIEGYIPFPQKEGKELFALHVSGLSMRDAGILDGDYVVAEKTPTSSDGEIVVALSLIHIFRLPCCGRRCAGSTDGRAFILRGRCG